MITNLHLRDPLLATPRGGPADAMSTQERIAWLVSTLTPGAVVARRTAAHLHGIFLTMPAERYLPVPLQTIRPRGSEPLSRNGVLGYSSTLHEGDVVLLDGTPVTSIERTLLDVARYETPPLALATLDLALRRGLVRPSELLRQAKLFTGDRGIGQARRLIRLADPRSESPAESWTRLRIADAGLPRPDLQIKVPRDTGAPLRIDLGWREEMVGVEYDGRENHDGPADRRADARRREFLQSVGWTMLPIDVGAVLSRSTAFEESLVALLGLQVRIRPRRW